MVLGGDERIGKTQAERQGQRKTQAVAAAQGSTAAKPLAAMKPGRRQEIQGIQDRHILRSGPETPLRAGDARRTVTLPLEADASRQPAELRIKAARQKLAVSDEEGAPRGSGINWKPTSPASGCQSAGLLPRFRSMRMRPNASCSAMQVKTGDAWTFPSYCTRCGTTDTTRSWSKLVEALHRRQKPRETFSLGQLDAVCGAEEGNDHFIHAATRWDGMSAAAQPSRCVIR